MITLVSLLLLRLLALFEKQMNGDRWILKRRHMKNKASTHAHVYTISLATLAKQQQQHRQQQQQQHQ